MRDPEASAAWQDVEDALELLTVENGAARVRILVALARARAADAQQLFEANSATDLLQKQIAATRAALTQAQQDLETEKAERTRAAIHYTFKGYQAGENTDSKHWRQRAESAERKLVEAQQENEQWRRSCDNAAKVITSFDKALAQAQKTITDLRAELDVSR